MAELGLDPGWVGSALLLVFGAVGVYAGGYWAVLAYNGFVQMRHDVDKAWSDVDVLLHQRHDELGKLVSTAQGYIDHEHDVLVKVTEARRQFGAAGTRDEQAGTAGFTDAALAEFFAVAEHYPDLKADRSFQALAGRITELEVQIADRREHYNHRVNVFNIAIDQFPQLLVARACSFTAQRLYEAVDRRVLQDVEIAFERSSA